MLALKVSMFLKEKSVYPCLVPTMSVKKYAHRARLLFFPKNTLLYMFSAKYIAIAEYLDLDFRSMILNIQYIALIQHVTQGKHPTTGFLCYKHMHITCIFKDICMQNRIKSLLHLSLILIMLILIDTSHTDSIDTNT